MKDTRLQTKRAKQQQYLEAESVEEREARLENKKLRYQQSKGKLGLEGEAGSATLYKLYTRT